MIDRIPLLVRLALALAIGAALVPCASARPSDYSYDEVHELPRRAVTSATLTLFESTLQEGRAHVAVWLSAGTALADTWFQVGITTEHTESFVYVETKTPRRERLVNVAPYVFGTPVRVRLVKRPAPRGRDDWWIHVDGRRFGPVRIWQALIEVGGESWVETGPDGNTYRGAIRLPRVTFYPSK